MWPTIIIASLIAIAVIAIIINEIKKRKEGNKELAGDPSRRFDSETDDGVFGRTRASDQRAFLSSAGACLA